MLPFPTRYATSKANCEVSIKELKGYLEEFAPTIEKGFALRLAKKQFGLSEEGEKELKRVETLIEKAEIRNARENLIWWEARLKEHI